MNKKFVVVIVLAMLVVATGFSVSGTYAKYTSNITGTDEARVAKWAFTIGNDANVVTTKTFAFDLFDHSNSYVNSDVIAPGTSGSTASITLENNSEVDATYEIEYTITNAAGIPVVFTIDGEEQTLTPVVGEDGSSTGVSTFTVTPENGVIARDDSATLEALEWEWKYYVDDAADEKDTELGIAGTATIKVEAKIIVTQYNG